MKLMITITLTTELGSKGFITTVEVTYVRRCSSETNKLRYVHSIRGTPRDGTLIISKSKSSRLSYILVETVPLDDDKFKSINVTSVSGE